MPKGMKYETENEEMKKEKKMEEEGTYHISQLNRDPD
jgi:hypothetical protein